jgi:hypothetical protein
MWHLEATGEDWFADIFREFLTKLKEIRKTE